MRPNGLHLALGRAANPNAPPSAGLALHLRADRGLYTGGAQSFTAPNKCKLAGGSLPIGTDDFWLEIWFQISATGSYMTILTTMADGGNDGNTGFTVMLYVPTGQLVLTFEDAAHSARTLRFGFSGAMADGSINQLVATFARAGVAQCYLNGAASGTTLDISGHAGNLTTAQTTIGANYDHSSPWNGILQCARIGIGALPTAAEILALYNNSNPLKYAQLPAAILAKLGANGAAWDLDENLIDATHPAEDSHGSNDLTFTPATINANGTFTDADGTSPPTGWTNHATYPWDTCDVQSGKMRLASNGDGTPAGMSAYQQIQLTSGHTYRIQYDYTRTAGPVQVTYSDSPDLGTAAKGYDATHYSTAAVDTTFTATASNGYLRFWRGNDLAAMDERFDNIALTATRLYPVNGFQTAVASDVSGSGNHATLTGFSAARQVTAWTTATHDGAGQALTLDGASDYLNCGAWGTKTGTTFTASLWFKCTGTNGRLIGTRNGTGKTWELFVESGTGHLAASDNDVATFASDVDVNDNVWRHGAVVFNGAASKLYVNGVAVKTFSPNLAAGSYGELCIGTINLGTLCLNGTVDDVRIYNEPFTDAQVAELAAADADTHPTGAATPVLHLTFDDDGPSYTVSDGDPVLAIDSCEGNRRRFAQDNILKRPLWIANVFGDKPALRFDGVDDYLAYVGAALSGDVGTVVLYGRWTAAVDGTFLSLGNTSDATRCLQMRMREAAHANAMFYQRDADTQDTVRGSTNTVVNTPACWVFASDGTSLFMWVNGAAQTLIGACADWFNDVTGANITALGALYRTSAGSFDALDLAELRVYDRVLTATELARLWKYAQTRYGIAP